MRNAAQRRARSRAHLCGLKEKFTPRLGTLGLFVIKSWNLRSTYESTETRSPVMTIVTRFYLLRRETTILRSNFRFRVFCS